MPKSAVSAIVPVILCGGSGTRLWPASREKFPKQFLALMGEHTLLQQTALRTMRTTGAKAADLVTVTLGDLSGHVAGQLAQIDAAAARHILCEPSARNTAAAVAFAACHVEALHGPDALMLVLPSDHHIADEKTLSDAFATGLKAAESGLLVTFGIRPTRPETGYGYIRLGETIGTLPGVQRAAAFVEKPKLDVAKSYLADGNYLWNSGMFMFKAGKVLAEFERYSPQILARVREAIAAGESHRPDAQLYASIPSEAFDVAIMERSADVAVVPCHPQWSDIGSWESLWEIREKDANQNVIQGNAAAHASHGCVVLAKSERLIACAGLTNIVVVDTGDSILIADRSNADSLKALVGELKKAGNPHVIKLPETLIVK